MKDDKEHIDKLFESLNDRQFDIPEAFLEDLNKRLDNEPKKRRFFFLWFLAPIVLIGAIGFCYFLFAGKSAGNSPVGQKDKRIVKDDLKAQNTIRLNKQHSIDSISARRQQVETPFKILKKTDKPTIASSQFQSGKVSFRANKLQINQQSKQYQSSHKKSSFKNLKKHQPVGTNSKMGSKMLLNTDNNEQAPDKTTPTSIPEPKTHASLTVKELPKDSIAEKTDSTLAKNSVDTTQQVNSAQDKKDEITSNKPGNDWRKEIQLFAGLGGNSIHDSSKNPEYLAKINQNQSSILAPSFGVNANLSYKKFTFGAGVKYEQTGEKFKVDLKNAELKDSTYSELIQDSIWVQDTTGNWIQIPHDTTIYYTVQYIDSVSQSRSFQNRYSWISIPLHFGYRFELGDYELIPRLGAVFNFGIVQGMGSYPNASFNDVYRYKPVKFNISYLIQLEARRNFEKCFVFINPYFQSMIGPSVSGDVIRRRYTSWGMQFGIGFKL